MRKIVHVFDGNIYSEMISEMLYDNDTLIYSELTDEMFRFVKPIDGNQTFDSWKGHIPKYSYKHFGNITNRITFGDLSESYGLYNESDLFSSDLTSKFMKDIKVYWQKKIGGIKSDAGYDVCVDGSGNVYVNGYQNSDSYGLYDYGVMKLYGDQESDMNLSIWDMNLSIGDVDMSGEVG